MGKDDYYDGEDESQWDLDTYRSKFRCIVGRLNERYMWSRVMRRQYAAVGTRNDEISAKYYKQTSVVRSLERREQKAYDETHDWRMKFNFLEMDYFAAKKKMNEMRVVHKYMMEELHLNATEILSLQKQLDRTATWERDEQRVPSRNITHEPEIRGDFKTWAAFDIPIRTPNKNNAAILEIEAELASTSSGRWTTRAKNTPIPSPAITQGQNAVKSATPMTKIAISRGHDTVARDSPMPESAISQEQGTEGIDTPMPEHAISQGQDTVPDPAISQGQDTEGRDIPMPKPATPKTQNAVTRDTDMPDSDPAISQGQNAVGRDTPMPEPAISNGQAAISSGSQNTRARGTAMSESVISSGQPATSTGSQNTRARGTPMHEHVISSEQTAISSAILDTGARDTPIPETVMFGQHTKTSSGSENTGARDTPMPETVMFSQHTGTSSGNENTGARDIPMPEHAVSQNDGEGLMEQNNTMKKHACIVDKDEPHATASGWPIRRLGYITPSEATTDKRLASEVMCEHLKIENRIAAPAKQMHGGEKQAKVSAANKTGKQKSPSKQSKSDSSHKIPFSPKIHFPSTPSRISRSLSFPEGFTSRAKSNADISPSTNETFNDLIICSAMKTSSASDKKKDNGAAWYRKTGKSIRSLATAGSSSTSKLPKIYETNSLALGKSRSSRFFSCDKITGPKLFRSKRVKTLNNIESPNARSRIFNDKTTCVRNN